MAASPSTPDLRQHYGALKALPNAEAAQVELERIRLANGGLIRPEVVVEAARDPQSPIHDLFEWDDARAAERWRVLQARVLIRLFIVAEGAPRYVSLVVEGQRGYLPVAEASVAEPLRLQMLRRAAAEADALRKRFAAISEISEAFALARDRIAAASE